jgi:hypothetical protein
VTQRNGGGDIFVDEESSQRLIHTSKMGMFSFSPTCPNGLYKQVVDIPDSVCAGLNVIGGPLPLQSGGGGKKFTVSFKAPAGQVAFVRSFNIVYELSATAVGHANWDLAVAGTSLHTGTTPVNVNGLISQGGIGMPQYCVQNQLESLHLCIGNDAKPVGMTTYGGTSQNEARPPQVIALMINEWAQRFTAFNKPNSCVYRNALFGNLRAGQMNANRRLTGNTSVLLCEEPLHMQGLFPPASVLNRKQCLESQMHLCHFPPGMEGKIVFTLADGPDRNFVGRIRNVVGAADALVYWQIKNMRLEFMTGQITSRIENPFSINQVKVQGPPDLYGSSDPENSDNVSRGIVTRIPSFDYVFKSVACPVIGAGAQQAMTFSLNSQNTQFVPELIILFVANPSSFLPGTAQGYFGLNASYWRCGKPGALNSVALTGYGEIGSLGTDTLGSLLGDGKWNTTNTTDVQLLNQIICGKLLNEDDGDGYSEEVLYNLSSIEAFAADPLVFDSVRDSIPGSNYTAASAANALWQGMYVVRPYSSTVLNKDNNEVPVTGLCNLTVMLNTNSYANGDALYAAGLYRSQVGIGVNEGGVTLAPTYYCDYMTTKLSGTVRGP